VAPQCPEELSAPRLHHVLQHPNVRSLCLGGKGVGSQGDGSAQFVCSTAAQQQDLAAVLTSLGCCPLLFTL
jgi:hypothetical protein